MATRLIDRRASQKKVGSVPKRVLISAGGGSTFISGSFKYHVFTSTESFKIFYKKTGSLFFDYLVVGGGQTGTSGSNGEYNGGQGGNGGNGGSGSYKTATSQSFSLFNSNVPYTVTVGGAGSHSTIATNSTTITSAGGVSRTGGTGGNGETSNPTCTVEEICDPECYCPSDCYQCAGDPGSGGSNGQLPFSGSIIFGGPSSSYAAGGGGGGGAGGNTGGATGGSSSRGIGGTGGDPGSAGANGLPNSGDGGCGGGGGDPCCNNTSGCTADNICNTTKFGGAPGLGGSGIVYIRYLFEQ